MNPAVLALSAPRLPNHQLRRITAGKRRCRSRHVQLNQLRQHHQKRLPATTRSVKVKIPAMSVQTTAGVRPRQDDDFEYEKF